MILTLSSDCPPKRRPSSINSTICCATNRQWLLQADSWRSSAKWRGSKWPTSLLVNFSKSTASAHLGWNSSLCTTTTKGMVILTANIAVSNSLRMIMQNRFLWATVGVLLFRCSLRLVKWGIIWAKTILFKPWQRSDSSLILW